MASVETIIDRVEKRLSIASGLNVQIHAEDKFLEMIRHKYNTLFDDHWWFDYLTLDTYTLDPLTGLITGSVANKILRFQDIHSVFLGSNDRPLPLLNIGTNPSGQIRESIAPYTVDATKMFKVYPLNRSDSVYVWYRTRIADDAWTLEKASSTNINMDDELLILGTVYDYLSDDGSNDVAADKYEKQYIQRLNQLVTLGFQHGISKIGDSTSIPTQWSMNGTD